MLKLSSKYSESYPNYEFRNLKFVVRDFTVKFYSDCKTLEREFNRFIIKDNFQAQKDVIEMSDSFSKLFENITVEEYDDLQNNKEKFAAAKEKILENIINNREDAEHVLITLANQNIDFESCKELFLCASTSIDHAPVSNMRLVLETFTKSDGFDKINFEPSTPDELFELLEFVKIVFDDFFLYIQKSRKK